MLMSSDFDPARHTRSTDTGGRARFNRARQVHVLNLLIDLPTMVGCSTPLAGRPAGVKVTMTVWLPTSRVLHVR